MAENNVYTLIVEMGGDTTDDNDGNAGNADKNNSGGKSNALSTKALKGLFAVETVKPFAMTTITYFTNRVGMFSGSQDLQQKHDFGMQIASSIEGLGRTTITGFAAGGVIGAGIGLGLGVLKMGVDYAIRRADYNWNAQIDTINARYAQQRQGFAFNRSRQNV